MAPQTPKAPEEKPAKAAAQKAPSARAAARAAAKAAPSSEPKRGVKNPFLYAGTIVLFVVVVVAFVLVPAGGGAAGSGSQGALEFGRYAGKGIDYASGSYFAKQVQSLNDELRQQGLSEDNFQFFAYQVWRGAFERTVVRYAILDEMNRSGATLTEARVDAKVAENPSFQEDGVFSVSRYRSASLAEKLAIREATREDELTQAYYSDIMGTSTSSKEIDFVKSMAKETRTIEYAALPLSLFPDAEVQAWASANADLFRGLQLSRITASDSEAEAKKLFEKVKADPASFEAVAKESSKDGYADKGGTMGLKYFHEVAAELAEKADAEKLGSLEKGSLSDIFKTAAGSWTFYRAEAAALPADAKEPSLLAAARGYMLRNEKGKLEEWALAKAKGIAAAAGGGSGFAAAVKKEGLEIKSTGPFPLNYGDLAISFYGQSLPVFGQIAGDGAEELLGASTNEAFLTAAFSTSPGSVAQPLVMGENVIIMSVKEAGSALDSDVASIEYYYPAVVQRAADSELREAILESPRLKDNFSDVFFKYFRTASN